MPVARVQMPDGRIGRFEVPEGMTPQEVESFVLQGPPQAGHRFLGASPPPIPEVTGYGPNLQPIAGVRQTPRSESALEAAQASTAGEVQRLVTGAQMLGQSHTQPSLERASLRDRRAELAREQAERSQDYPVASFVGQMAPYGAIPQRAVATLPRAMGTGGMTGFVAGGGDPVEAGVGAAGGAMGYGAGRMLGGPEPHLSPYQKRALQAGREAGIQPLPSEVTGSKGLQIYEAALESDVLGAGPIGRIPARNQTRANQLAARSIGETGDAMDDAVLGRAYARIEDEFKDIARGVRASLDDQFFSEMDAVETAVRGSIVGTDAEVRIPSTINRLLGKTQKDSLSGGDLMRFTSQLRREAASKLRGEKKDFEMGEAYYAVADVLDDLLARNVTGKKVERLATVREQWQNFKILERAGVVRGGNVSPPVLANNLRKHRVMEYRRGGRQGAETPTDRLFAVARMSDAFTTPFGRSGTPERQSLERLLGRGAWTGGGSYALTSDPALSAGIGLAGIGVPSALARLYPWPAATGLLGLPATAARGAATGGGRFGAPAAREIYRRRSNEY